MKAACVRAVFLIVLCFVCHAHLIGTDLHGSYIVDDYNGIWTKFDGIGAVSGGGVRVPFCCFV